MLNTLPVSLEKHVLYRADPLWESVHCQQNLDMSVLTSYVSQTNEQDLTGILSVAVVLMYLQGMNYAKYNYTMYLIII